MPSCSTMCRRFTLLPSGFNRFFSENLLKPAETNRCYPDFCFGQYRLIVVFFFLLVCSLTCPPLVASLFLVVLHNVVRVFVCVWCVVFLLSRGTRQAAILPPPLTTKREERGDIPSPSSISCDVLLAAVYFSSRLKLGVHHIISVFGIYFHGSKPPWTFCLLPWK